MRNAERGMRNERQQRLTPSRKERWEPGQRLRLEACILYPGGLPLQPQASSLRTDKSVTMCWPVARGSQPVTTNPLSFDVEHLPLALGAPRDYDGNGPCQVVGKARTVRR